MNKKYCLAACVNCNILGGGQGQPFGRYSCRFSLPFVAYLVQLCPISWNALVASSVLFDYKGVSEIFNLKKRASDCCLIVAICKQGDRLSFRARSSEVT